MLDPFRGTLFDPAAVADPGAATSPPYDVIDAVERTRLLAASPYNIVRVLLPDGDDERYQRAAAELRGWRASGILFDDAEPRLYLYEMRWDDGRSHLARGVIGALQVTELGGQILPHEETMAGTRADRLAVLEATQANLDPIVALSASERLRSLLSQPGEPRVSASADGVEHRLSDIPADLAAEIVAEVAAHTVSIADGHHRYTTALHHAEGRGPGPWWRIMAMVAPAAGSGLTVAPYHRTFPGPPPDPARLTEAFTVTDTPPLAPDDPGSLVIATTAGALLLRPRPDAVASLPGPLRLASAAVARDVLYPLVGFTEDDAEYTPSAAAALAAAAAGRTAVLVAPVPEQAIAAASEAGLRFPQKSTFFTPKPRAGLVLRMFDTV